MPMLSPVLRENCLKRYQFLCAYHGCGWHEIPIIGVTPPEHWFKSRRNPKPHAWTFSGTLEAPTFRASLLTSYFNEAKKRDVAICHLYVTAGKIEYLNDCAHEARGTTVAMPVWDDKAIARADSLDDYLQARP
jgi:hypothetical protein